MNAAELAREVDLPTPTIHRLVTGKSTRPYRSSLEPIAKFFNISINQLIGEEPLAEFMPLATSEVLAKKNLSIKMAPLLEWHNLSDLVQARKTAIKYVPLVGNVSDDCFSLLMPDHSMEPVFPEHTILIFDPHKKAFDRSYVLVKLDGIETPIFRQLLVDIDQQYLKPLNHDLSVYKMRLLNPKDIILATLFESRNNFSKEPSMNVMEIPHDH